MQAAIAGASFSTTDVWKFALPRIRAQNLAVTESYGVRQIFDFVWVHFGSLQ